MLEMRSQPESRTNRRGHQSFPYAFCINLIDVLTEKLYN